jgi:hypothetical protein
MSREQYIKYLYVTTIMTLITIKIENYWLKWVVPTRTSPSRRVSNDVRTSKARMGEGPPT